MDVVLGPSLLMSCKGDGGWQGGEPAEAMHPWIYFF